jgi:hypothetical protein
MAVGAIVARKELAQRSALRCEVMGKVAGSPSWAVAFVKIRLAGSGLVWIVRKLAVVSKAGTYTMCQWFFPSEQDPMGRLASSARSRGVKEILFKCECVEWRVPVRVK